MKYTETLFRFPVKISDGFSVRKNIKKEELLMDDLEAPLPDDWVEGVVEIPLKEICGVIDHFSAERRVEQVAKEGFDSSLIMTHTLGDYVCTLTRKQFKERLNAFADRYEKMIDEFAEELLEKKVDVLPPKKSFWKRFFS